MPIDSSARDFVAEGLQHYREVSRALEEFETQTEGWMRTIAQEFESRFSSLGIKIAELDFKTGALNDRSRAWLEKERNGVIIDMGLHAVDGDERGPLAAYSGVGFRDPTLRASFQDHFKRLATGEFYYDREGRISYVWKYFQMERRFEAFDLLRATLAELFRIVSDVPELRRDGDRR